jgi:hypothetical protein
MKNIRVPMSAAAALVLWLHPAEMAAQVLRDSTLIPVVVMVPPSGQQDAAIRITRSEKDGYRILLPRSVATPENLRTAIRMVSQLLDRDGDDFRDGSVFRVEAGQSYTLGESPGSQRIIEDLLKAAGGGNRGDAPAVTIYLPDARRRALDRSGASGGT